MRWSRVRIYRRTAPRRALGAGATVEAMDERTHLPGGSGGVWFAVDPVLGPVVHRPTGPWTPAVHDLLAFVAAARLDGVPRVLGFDDEGHEVLTHLGGRTIEVDEDAAPDDVLTDAVAWLRRYHD